MRELVGWSYAVGALERGVYCRGRGESRCAEADAGQLVDAVAGAYYRVAEDVVVEAGAWQDSSVDIWNQAVGSAIETCKLNSALLLRRRINDVWVEGIHVVVCFGERAVELVAESEIDSEFLCKPVVVLDIAGEKVQV